jgi:hypothetical protein
MGFWGYNNYATARAPSPSTPAPALKDCNRNCQPFKWRSIPVTTAPHFYPDSTSQLLSFS